MSRIQRTAAPGSSSGGGAVESVNGKTGVVTLAAADVAAISTAPESVTTSEIKARAVTEEKLAEAVALLLLGNERVITGDIAGKAVTEPKLATAVLERLLLTGGTTGQALIKKSNTNYEVEWATVSGGGPLTFVAVESLNVKLENEGGGTKEYAPVAVATGTDGMSHLTGVLKAALAIPANTMMFLLPTAHRPTKRKRLVMSVTGAPTAERLTFTIETNGEVKNAGGEITIASILSFDDVTWAHEH